MPRHPDRTPVVDLISDLRDEAEDIAPDLQDGVAHQTTYGEAAQTLEEFSEALTQIADGGDSPRAIAADALSLAKPLKPIGEAADTIRNLLKPRRT